MKPWTTEDSSKIYNLKGWGLKYFGVNPEGHLTVHPRGGSGSAIDLHAVVGDVLGRGIKLPALFRFPGILRHRVKKINEAFKRAIAEHSYRGRYFGIYPIKVNQLREVVEEISDAGREFEMGLEAGSRGELMAVLAMNSAPALTIVNGYKDEMMMRLAMIGIKLGKPVIVVVERPADLELLLKAARELGVRPLVGFRAKLQAQGSGRWKSSSGPAAKFGLTTPELLGAVSHLRAEGMLDCVKLLHFHIGSQISDIQTIKDSVKEAARLYSKLKKMGLGLEYLDCGGGFGVDYDGTHTNVESSINYTLMEYAQSLVATIREVCRQEKVLEPHIITESGRALVAHHSLLVVNAFQAILTEPTWTAPPKTDAAGPEEHEVVGQMQSLIAGLSCENLTESYHGGLERREEANSLFKLGYLGLEDKAKAESLFWTLCRQIARLTPEAGEVPDEVAAISESLSDQYLCNFSIFQSLPDSWAIGQLFPIVPIHRLNEEPARRATLVDITCDSDGRVSQFSCHRKAGGRLPVHPLNNEPYYLGVFLMGAYQATMGDIHNLFGRVNEVHVFEDDSESGGYYLENTVPGQSMGDVLSSIQYNGYELVKMVKDSVEAQVKAGLLKPREGVDLVNEYETAMQQYTYLDAAGGAMESAVVAHNGHNGNGNLEEVK